MKNIVCSTNERTYNNKFITITIKYILYLNMGYECYFHRCDKI